MPETLDFKSYMKRKAIALDELQDRRIAGLRVKSGQQLFASFLELWKFHQQSLGAEAHETNAKLRETEFRKNLVARAKIFARLRPI